MFKIEFRTDIYNSKLIRISIININYTTMWEEEKNYYFNKYNFFPFKEKTYKKILIYFYPTNYIIRMSQPNDFFRNVIISVKDKSNFNTYENIPRYGFSLRLFIDKYYMNKLNKRFGYHIRRDRLCKQVNTIENLSSTRYFEISKVGRLLKFTNNAKDIDVIFNQNNTIKEFRNKTSVLRFYPLGNLQYFRLKNGRPKI